MVLYFFTFIITGCLVTGLKEVKVTVPMAARKGDSVVLYCQYNLEGDSLYAIKWYKGRDEFYRYTQTDNPAIKLFSLPELPAFLVDVRVTRRSNETQVFLTNVTPSMSGQYNCEVSADAPSFHTAIAASFMKVVDVPLRPPILKGVKEKYRVRDTLRANCTAAPSRPAANLTWSVNGESVNSEMVRQYRSVPESHPEQELSTSILEVPLREQHFTRSGRMEVRCTASLYDLYWQTTESITQVEDHREIKVRVTEYDNYEDDVENAIPQASPSTTSQGNLPSSITKGVSLSYDVHMYVSALVYTHLLL